MMSNKQNRRDCNARAMHNIWKLLGFGILRLGLLYFSGRIVIMV